MFSNGQLKNTSSFSGRLISNCLQFRIERDCPFYSTFVAVGEAGKSAVVNRLLLRLKSNAVVMLATVHSMDSQAVSLGHIQWQHMPYFGAIICRFQNFCAVHSD